MKKILIVEFDNDRPLNKQWLMADNGEYLFSVKDFQELTLPSIEQWFITKINGCDEMGGMDREKATYQQCLKMIRTKMKGGE